MALDNAKNFAKVTVSTGYDSAATSIVLTTGHGAKLPTVPFNAVWWNSTDYPDPADDPDVEIVRVTARSTDTLTVTRAQEGTSGSNKNISGKTYKMIAGLTAKAINTDVYNPTTIELGHASDTTLSRASAGQLAVEGVQVATISNSVTLTNKRHQPRISSTTSGDFTPAVGTADVYIRTAQSAAITISNPTGSPAQGEKLIIRLKDNGTARAITWGSEYRGIAAALPTTTVISKTMYCGFIFNSTDTKWDLIAYALEA